MKIYLVFNANGKFDKIFLSQQAAIDFVVNNSTTYWVGFETEDSLQDVPIYKFDLNTGFQSVFFTEEQKDKLAERISARCVKHILNPKVPEKNQLIFLVNSDGIFAITAKEYLENLDQEYIFASSLTEAMKIFLKSRGES